MIPSRSQRGVERDGRDIADEAVCTTGKESHPDTDRGGKPGLTPECPLYAEVIHHMRRHLIAVYVLGATVATLVAANAAVAATWIRR